MTPLLHTSQSSDHQLCTGTFIDPAAVPFHDLVEIKAPTSMLFMTLLPRSSATSLLSLSLAHSLARDSLYPVVVESRRNIVSPPDQFLYDVHTRAKRSMLPTASVRV